MARVSSPRTPPVVTRPAWLIVALTLVALSALLVGFNPLGVSQGTDLPMLSLGVCGLIAVALLPGATGAPSIVHWRVTWVATAWLVWALITSLLSHRGVSALVGLTGSDEGWLAVCTFAVVVLAASCRSVGVRQVLRYAAPVVVIAESSLAVWEWANKIHPGGSLSNSSYLGLVLVLLVPACVHVALETRSIWWRVAGWLAAVMAPVALLLGDSKAALVGLVAWAGVMIVIGLRRRKAWNTAKAVAVVGAAAAVLAALAVTVVGLASVVASLTVFLQDRSRLWVPAYQAFLTRPVTGWGLDGFQSGIYRLATRTTLEGSGGFGQLSPDPHNIVLNVAVSAGVVGVGLLVWLFAEVVLDWSRQARAGAGADAAPWVAGVLMYGLVILTAPAALQTLPLFAMVVGASLRIDAANGRTAPRGTMVAVRGVAIVVSALVVAMALTRLSISRVDRPDQGDAPLTQTLADAWHFDPFLYYWASINWGYAGQRDPVVAAARPDLAAIQRAVALEPDNPIYQTELARTLGYYGQPRDQVEAAFTKAFALFPNSPDAHAGYAEYLVSQGDLSQAKKVLDEGLAQVSSLELMRVAAVYYRAAGDEAKAATFDAGIKAADDEARARGFHP